MIPEPNRTCKSGYTLEVWLSCVDRIEDVQGKRSDNQISHVAQILA